MRKPREHGWLAPDGITHHIDTRHHSAYHPYVRTATCGFQLREARRVRVDGVDCMTCIVRAARYPRLNPRPEPGRFTPSWWTVGGQRHVLSANNPWRAVCGASLRKASGSGNLPNCVACGCSVSNDVYKTHSLRGLDGIRHEYDPTSEHFAPCGADILVVTVVRKEPNCPGCCDVITEARRAQKRRERGRLPQHQR